MLLAGGRAEAADKASNISVGNARVGRPKLTDLAPDRPPDAQLDISREDCLEDRYTLTLTVNVARRAKNTGIEIWGTEGADCTISQNRDGERCVRIGAALPDDQVVLHARELVRAIPSIDERTCADSSRTTIPHVLTLYFMLQPLARDGDTANSTTWQTNVDLLGPMPPFGADVLPGNEMLLVKIPPSHDPDRAGYLIYCDPVLTGEARRDHGSAGGEGEAAGRVTIPPSPILTSVDAGAASCIDRIPGLEAGKPPPRHSHYRCGDKVNKDATTIPLAGATNGTRYVFAIAAYDKLGNIGPLSGSLCQMPAPTDTFWVGYCQNDGVACPGCGQCSVDPAARGAWPALGMALLATAGLLARKSRGSCGGARSRG